MTAPNINLTEYLISPELQERLFSLGGNRVFMDDPELTANRLTEGFLKETQNLLDKGKLFDNRAAVIAGPDKACHASAAALFFFLDRRIEMVTGWALAPDNHPHSGMWSEHTWTHFDGQTIEPTPIRRKIYFGAVHPNPVDWATFELERKNWLRTDPIDYLDLFNPNSWEYLLGLKSRVAVCSNS